MPRRRTGRYASFPSQKDIKITANSVASFKDTTGGENKDEPLLPTVQLVESYAIISNLLTFVFPVPPSSSDHRADLGAPFCGTEV